MNKDMFLRYKAISLFSGVAAEVAPLAELLTCETDAARVSGCARVFAALADAGADSTGEWIQRLVESDDNAFSRAAARGERIPARIKAQAEVELNTFKQLSLLKPDDFSTDEVSGFIAKFGFGGFNVGYDRLVKFYAANGCGVLAHGNTFLYNGEFTPAASGGVRLSDIKNYAEEKAEIVKNTENFIAGLPAFHALLYGDRGTGKSSTVRALANEYKNKLKVIELSKDAIFDLPGLYAKLDGLKQRYILFVDDLSFSEEDCRVDGFKAALEGSFATTNALLYCTSNRRHIFKESERQRRNDDVQAELALFDRFGLVVTYINPDKAGFLDILKQILSSRGIKWREEYASIAELAALKKGGRSPRAAKQIADLIESTCAEHEKR